jgi:antitoxin HicB
MFAGPLHLAARLAILGRVGGSFVREVLLGLQIEPLEEGGLVATSDELPGLVAQGRTVAETLEIAEDVAIGLIESYLEHGDPLPEGLLEAATATGKVQIPVMLP